MLGIYFDEYCDLSEARRKNMDFKYDPTNLTLSVCSYENWDKEKPDDSTVTNDKEKFYDSSPLQQGDKEVKAKKGLKIQTFICTNNSWKYFIQLKDEIRQILYLCISIIKSQKPSHFNQVIIIMRLYTDDNKE